MKFTELLENDPGVVRFVKEFAVPAGEKSVSLISSGSSASEGFENGDKENWRTTPPSAACWLASETDSARSR